MVKMVTPRKALEYKDSEGNSPFKKWLTELKDARGRVKVTKAITQMESGNFGDHKPITDGNGLQERRINYGPGYRIYYITEGDKLIVIFAGGDKNSQTDDIKFTKEYYKDYCERKPKEPIEEPAKVNLKRIKKRR